MPRKPIQNLNGYVLIYKPEHHKAIKARGYKGYVYEHVLVAEEFLGRYIKEHEDVHHLDGNRANNSPENILVIEHSQHTKLHNWIRKSLSKAKTNENNYSVRRCETCKKIISSNKKRFCSVACMKKEYASKNKPDKTHLFEDFLNLSNNKSAIGRKYNVSSSTISKWLKGYGII